MSGRSGRRGFDSIGNVVFLMIPQFKVARLLMSALPDLSGHFPLNSSLVLRSLLYLTQCSKEKEDEKFAKSVVSGLVSESLFCLGQEHLTKTVSHHLRISVAFLQQLGMIDQFGNLIDLAGIALHLFWSEPSNFLLAYLLREGVFHNICKNADKEQVMLDIIHLMAHLFERVDVPQVSQSKDGSTINITLKPLESNIQEKMQIFDDLAFDVYVKYCKAYSIYYSISECVLPISKISYSLKKKDLSKELNLDRIDFHARSPFSALSGRGDEFSSVIDLSRNLRSDIFIDMFSIPIFDIKKKMVPKNSYLLDFFKHGQIVAIERDNRIRSGVSWQTLKTFDLVLQTIVVSLKQRDAEMNDPRDKNVIEGFESASNRFSEYFQNIGSLH